MPVNKHLIPPRPRDRGSAVSLADQRRNLRKLNGLVGFVGNAANVVGATIATADSGARVVLQGADALGSPVVSDAAEGLYCVDSAGAVVVSLTPGIGLALTSGDSQLNYVSWFTSGHLDGYINVAPVGTGSDMQLNAFSQNHARVIGLDISAANTGNSAISVFYNGTAVAILADQNGTASFNGSLTVAGAARAGAAAMGTWTSGDYATFGYAGLGAGAYALLQNNSGSDTFVNCTSTGHLRISNGDVLLWSPGTVVVEGNFAATGSVGSPNFVNTSDIALKDDIETLDAKDVIGRLKPVSYTLKADDERKRYFGFIAQDVQKVLPDAVTRVTTTEDADLLGYNTTAIVAHLVAEVQQLRDRVAAVESK